MDIERVLARVVQNTVDGCWSWGGAHTKPGYAYYSRTDGTSYVHRIMYEHLAGPVPEGLELDHLCRNRGCVNPAHLEPVTHQENVRRGMAGMASAERNRQRGAAVIECPAGHGYTASNTYTYTNPRTGWTMRHCRACNRAARAQRYARDKAA